MKPHRPTNMLLFAAIILCVTTIGRAEAFGLKDFLKKKATEAVRNAKDITLQKGAKLVFPLQEDSAVARPSSPLLDHFEPQRFQPMTNLPRTKFGGFKLKPGAFIFVSQSYCLKPGSYQRSGGSGYLSGPIKGRFAAYFTSILRGAYRHPEISQQDIQYLLWGMIAGTKLQNMSRHIQSVAAKLIPKTQIRRLKRGKFGFLPNEIGERALRKLPRSVQGYVATLQRMKRLAARPDTSYRDLERIAVLTGKPPSAGAGAIPTGRWSYHPDGYYIRYFSTDYRKTTVQIVVPEKYTLRRDRRGRIFELRFADGSGVKTIYDDTQTPITLKGFLGRAAYALKSVVYRARNKVTGKIRRFTIRNRGWIFAPFSGKGPHRQINRTVAATSATPDSFSAQPRLVVASDQGWHLLNTVARDNARGGYAHPVAQLLPVIRGTREMYDRVSGIRDDYNFYHDRVNAYRNRPTDADLDNVVNIQNYIDGAKAAATGDGPGWLVEQWERQYRAIARATQLIEDLDKDPSELGIYDPTRESGLPSATSYSQRRGISPRAY